MSGGNQRHQNESNTFSRLNYIENYMNSSNDELERSTFPIFKEIPSSQQFLNQKIIVYVFYAIAEYTFLYQRDYIKVLSDHCKLIIKLSQ
jgi:hypothetical protein